MLGLQLPHEFVTNFLPEVLINKMLAGPTPGDNKRTILIVDDFDDTRLLLRTWLEKKGYRVVEAENGKKGVVAAESGGVDLIIMDMEMPELDGLSATRKIREFTDAKTTPIVAVSAYGADLFRADALAAGCNEYVSTPFEPEELERLIETLIKEAHSEDS
jgi:CheY-like chemotaxis protein